MRTENLTYSGYPATYNSSLSSSSGAYNPNNGCTQSGSTTYAEFTSSKQQQRSYYYDFNVTGISNYAVITNVTCVIRARTAGTGNNYMSYAQLCVGTSGKASETQINQTTTGTPIFLTTGTDWVKSDFDNLNIKISTNRTANNRYVRFYGANLIVKYSITYYSIATSSSTQKATISSSKNETESGNSVTITVNTNNLSDIIIKQNGVDVTGNFTGSNGTYRYTYSNVNTDTDFSVDELGGLSIKKNGVWETATHAYKKISGSWVEQTDLTTLFESNKLYFNK